VDEYDAGDDEQNHALLDAFEACGAEVALCGPAVYARANITSAFISTVFWRWDGDGSSVGRLTQLLTMSPTCRVALIDGILANRVLRRIRHVQGLVQFRERIVFTAFTFWCADDRILGWVSRKFPSAHARLDGPDRPAGSADDDSDDDLENISGASHTTGGSSSGSGRARPD
jgi:hypothetical protein